jgi:methyl-accepting chemotaxis protein
MLAQNRHLEQAKTTMEELRKALTSLTQYNENIQQNAMQVTAVAGNLVSTTDQGFNLSRNVQANVATLSDNIASALAETNSLMEESKKISDILTIMSEIAVMTKVLSINASIVAARAGEKGKEFDVVAKEVRKLSVGTEDSLSNISLLITDIQNKVIGVSDKLKTVSSGILNDKESMLSVAGTLQGVSLAVEIIRSITDVSGEKASESQQGLTKTLTLIDEVIDECTLKNAEASIHSQQSEIAGLLNRNK